MACPSAYFSEPTLSINDPITSDHIPVWFSLRTDPHHNYTVYDLTGVEHTGRCVMRLYDLPTDVPAYVKSKLGEINPYDWWWMRRGTQEDPWIEISIRTATVIQIESERFTLEELDLFDRIDNLIRPFGKIIGYGPEAVGVLGDARSVGRSVEIKFTENADVPTLSTLIINRIRGITRVMIALS